MQNRAWLWWLAPAGALILVAGVFGGMWLAKRSGVSPQAAEPERTVQVPGVGTSPAPKAGSSEPPAPEKPADPAPKAPPAEEPKRPNDSEALAFITKFMTARLNGDAAATNSMLAPALPNKAGIRVSKPGTRITGFTAELLGSGDPETFFYRVRVGFQSGHPGGEVAVENIKLTWKGGFQVASYEDVAKEAISVGVGSDGKLYVSRGQDTALAAELGTLPAEASPFGAPDGTKFGVGKDGWSIAVPSYTGGHVLWVTRGHHPLLGISQISWSGMPVVTPLDLLFEAGVTDAAWAPGAARYVAVATAQPSGAITLDVWDIAGKTRFGPDLKAAAGTMDFMVKNLRWASSQVVVFDMVKAGVPAGVWSYNAATKTLTHP